MKRIINVDSIIKNLPASFSLPINFDAFVSSITTNNPNLHAFFDILWTNPEDFELVKDAKLELIPFVRFGDGGIAAFWINTASNVPIIHINTEGGFHVAASSFDEFVKRIELQLTGIPDIDDPECKILFNFTKKDDIDLSELSSLDAQLKEWFKKNTALQQPILTSQTEEIRKKLHSIAYDMIKDGLNKVYTLESTYWSMSYKIYDNKEVCYLDYGNWYPVPSNYSVLEEALKLLPYTKSKKLETFELLIVNNGIVSINRDRELVLIPPGLRL